MVVKKVMLTSYLQFHFNISLYIVLKHNFKIAVNKNCSTTMRVTLYEELWPPTSLAS